jgi:hypothetical protein
LDHNPPTPPQFSTGDHSGFLSEVPPEVSSTAKLYEPESVAAETSNSAVVECGVVWSSFGKRDKSVEDDEDTNEIVDAKDVEGAEAAEAAFAAAEQTANQAFQAALSNIPTDGPLNDDDADYEDGRPSEHH